MRLVPQFRYLIGTRAELRRAWAAWHVLSVRQTAKVVDDIAYTALIDRTGKERVLYGADVHAREVVHDLRVLMHRSVDRPSLVRAVERAPAPHLRARLEGPWSET